MNSRGDRDQQRRQPSLAPPWTTKGSVLVVRTAKSDCEAFVPNFKTSGKDWIAVSSPSGPANSASKSRGTQRAATAWASFQHTCSCGILATALSLTRSSMGSPYSTYSRMAGSRMSRNIPRRRPDDRVITRTPKRAREETCRATQQERLIRPDYRAAPSCIDVVLCFNPTHEDCPHRYMRRDSRPLPGRLQEEPRSGHRLR